MGKLVKLLSFLVATIVLTTSSYATAQLQLILENSCLVPVEFNVHDDQSGQDITTQVMPNSYHISGIYSNSNTFKHDTSHIKISFQGDNSSGGLVLQLHNGWTGNKASFLKNSPNIAVDHNSVDDYYSKSWHSYTLSGQHNIPSFTVTSCPKSLRIKNSYLDGINRIVVFGDSLSDPGNLYRQTGGLIPKSTPYYTGCFSNGDPWAVQLQNMLKRNGVSFSNYSVGGATVIFEPHWATIGLPYSLSAETTMYSIDKKSWSPEKKMAIFFIGANDYLTANKNMSQKDIDHAVHQVTAKIISEVKKVNADKTVIIGLPNLGLTPESRELENQNVLSKLSAEHNRLLYQFAQNNKSIKFISLASIFDLLLKHTKKFNEIYKTTINVNKANSSCWSGGYFTASLQSNDSDNFYRSLLMKNDTGEISHSMINKIPLSPDIKATIVSGSSGHMCSDPNHYAFWDQVHVTYQVQKALYYYVLKQLHVEVE